MKKPAVFAKKAFVLAAFASSLLFGGNSPKAFDLPKQGTSCPNNGSPCVNLDCAYWQCCIDATYVGGGCAAVTSTYRSWMQVCPAIAQCNLNMRGCSK